MLVAVLVAALRRPAVSGQRPATQAVSSLQMRLQMRLVEETASKQASKQASSNCAGCCPTSTCCERPASEYAKAMEEYTPQKQENEERMEAASPSMSVAHSGDDRACS